MNKEQEEYQRFMNLPHDQFMIEMRQWLIQKKNKI